MKTDNGCTGEDNYNLQEPQLTPSVAAVVGAPKRLKRQQHHSAAAAGQQTFPTLGRLKSYGDLKRLSSYGDLPDYLKDNE